MISGVSVEFVVRFCAHFGISRLLELLTAVMEFLFEGGQFIAYGASTSELNQSFS